MEGLFCESFYDAVQLQTSAVLNEIYGDDEYEWKIMRGSKGIVVAIVKCYSAPRSIITSS
jgi:hypothetical protein